MIRGGHLDLCVLGALQVAQNGDLANWSTGRLRTRFPRSAGRWIWSPASRTIFVITKHCHEDGRAEARRGVHVSAHRAAGVVDRVYTDLAVIDVTPGRVPRLVELAPALTFEEVQEPDRRPAPSWPMPGRQTEMSTATKTSTQRRVLFADAQLKSARRAASAATPCCASRTRLYAEHRGGVPITDLEGVVADRLLPTTWRR